VFDAHVCTFGTFHLYSLDLTTLNYTLFVLSIAKTTIMSTIDQMNIDDPALARQRRMKQRAIQRVEEGDDASSKRQRHEDYGDDESEYSDPTKPSIRGIKQQARYVPGVPMTKAELAAWRKEARRVRNRESAADSRKKTRDRIGELEDEVKIMKAKYAAAVKRIEEVEAASSLHQQDCFTPNHMRQDLMENVISPSSSAAPSPEFSPEAMPISFCESSFSLDGRDEFSHHEQVSQKYQHIMNMISRPTAACVRITL
jgi:hypothetical protein